MKIKLFLVLTICLSCFTYGQAQEVKTMSLKEAVNTAWKNSNAAKISAEKVTTAERELNVTKNKQYPDFDISGQYKYLTNPNVDIKFDTSSNPSENGGDEENSETTATPHPNHLMVGQANLSVPVFSGFKLKNAIKAEENQYKAAQFSAKSDKENLALQTVKAYVALYKSRKMVDLVKQNLKNAEQRVTDFSNMEKNGLLARNDLLKAELQKSNVKLSLAKAKKNVRILNYRLTVFLKLPKNTTIATDSLSFGLMPVNPLATQDISRPDIEALRYQKKAADTRIKMKKGDYYPSIALTGGYLALDLQNTLTVTNALNFGVGVSYNLADIFKNKSDVKLAKSQAQEIQYRLDEAQDQVDIAIKNAREEYTLSVQNYQVYKKSKNQAAENYRIVKDKYDNGLVDTNDLLEADVQQLQSKIDLANAKANITQKYYELKEAQGKLTNEFTNK